MIDLGALAANPYPVGSLDYIFYALDAWFCPEGLAFAPPMVTPPPYVPPPVIPPYVPPYVPPPHIIPVPELSTWMLLLTGFIALALVSTLRRRRLI